MIGVKMDLRLNSPQVMETAELISANECRKMILRKSSSVMESFMWISTMGQIRLIGVRLFSGRDIGWIISRAVNMSVRTDDLAESEDWNII